jgi:hypothetical protein
MDAITNLINQVYLWVQEIGRLIALFGAFGFVLAWKNNNAESQSSASQYIAVGFMMMSFRTICQAIGF